MGDTSFLHKKKNNPHNKIQIMPHLTIPFNFYAIYNEDKKEKMQRGRLVYAIRTF